MAAVNPSGAQVELRHGDQVATVVEVGGALRDYRVGGRAALDGYGADEICTAARGQILIPWPNRIAGGRYALAGTEHQLALTEPEQGNAIHGLIRWANWTVGERSRERVVMEHVLRPQVGWAFTLALALQYTLSDGGLTLRTTATNLSSQPCPFGAGAHPYLTAGTDTIDACTLRAPGAFWQPTDDHQIPTGSQPVAGTRYDFRTARAIGGAELDTGYAELDRDGDGLARVELTAPDGARTTLWQDAAFPYLMLFTGDAVPEPQRRRRGLGVEPMTCAPNAFRSGEGLLVLEPGETFTGTWGIATGG